MPCLIALTFFLLILLLAFFLQSLDSFAAEHVREGLAHPSDALMQRGDPCAHSQESLMMRLKNVSQGLRRGECLGCLDLTGRGSDELLDGSNLLLECADA